MKKILKIYKNIPGAIILCIVFVPFIANMFASNTELLDNRALCTRPTKFSKSFSREYENYYNDTFAGRRKLVKKYLRIQDKLKIDTGRYFHGLEGWMYFDSAKASDGNSIVDYKGEVRFSDEELAKMKEGVETANAFYKKQGIEYVIVMAPSKENVYPEFMPMNMQKGRVSEVSRADAAIKYLQENTKVKIVNLKPNLLAEKCNFDQDFYFKRDTHWNRVGAYIGFEDITKALGVRVKPLTKSMIFEDGKVGVDMDANSKETFYKVSYMDDAVVNQASSEDHEKFLVFEAPKAPVKKTIFFFRDSFATDLTPYVVRTFAKSIFLHQSKNAHGVIEQYIAQYKPNIVVDELVERDFDRFLKYSDYYGKKGN